MLRNVNNLHGYSIVAADGPIGSVEELYFDDERWAVRYFVVDTGKWLPGRLVLVSPFAVQRADRSEGALHLSISREQVRQSPSVDTHRPISRAYEAAYADYFGYPYYWGGSALWGPAPYPAVVGPSLGAEIEARALAQAEAAVPAADEHLRSTRDVTGYHLQALDGKLGHVEDFLIEDDTWAIRYIVVDTSDWWFGKHVLIPPDWVREVDWTKRNLVVDVTRASVKQAPEFDSAEHVNRQWEADYFAHHRRSGYWLDEPEPPKRDQASGRP
jgi:hypothetical protein